MTNLITLGIVFWLEQFYLRTLFLVTEIELTVHPLGLPVTVGSLCLYMHICIYIHKLWYNWYEIQLLCHNPVCKVTLQKKRNSVGFLWFDIDGCFYNIVQHVMSYSHTSKTWHISILDITSRASILPGRGFLKNIKGGQYKHIPTHTYTYCSCV